MPSLDLAMPITLMIVITVAMLLNKRTEGKLKATVEEKEFKTRDVILLIVFMAVTVSVIAYSSLVAPDFVIQNIILIVFLTSYTMLLFTFSFVFSNISKIKTQLISSAFGIAAILAGAISTLVPFEDTFTLFRAIAFFILAAFCFGVVIFEQKKKTSKVRWYLAAQPAILFLLLFIFFNVIYTGTAQVWFPVLLDVFGLTFAILIIVYLSSMFSWKTVGIFAVLLTIYDFIQVIITGLMVTAAHAFTGLGLPVLVYLPKIPLTLAPANYPYLTVFGFVPTGLGLGDFFFAGLLTIQTFKKFGNKTALITIAAIGLAFGIFEAFSANIMSFLNSLVGREIGGFPATVIIILGWAPVVAWKLLRNRNKATKEPVSSEIAQIPKDPSLPVQ
ncbi:MAG TPA: hypothetical protein VF350_06775 [Candidatus Bathyarchaeia archaeon]